MASPCRCLRASQMASAAARCPPPVSDMRIRIRRVLLMRWGGCRLFPGMRNPLLDGFFELAAGEQHPAFAAQTAQADVRANAVHLPAVTAAGMALTGLHHVADLHVHRPE